MTAREIIKRYSLIINSMKRGQKPSRVAICNMILIVFKAQKTYSPSSFDRDISAIRHEFGIEILYDIYAKGYYIDYENSLNIKETLKYFELANSALAMIDTLKDGKEASNYLSLDSSDNLTGIELMEPIMSALKSKQIISFDYYNFLKETTSFNIIRPYLLKEYQNRWFLYGENEKYGDFRIYGIERISNLVLTGNYFVPQTGIDPKDNFENVIGIALRPIIEGQPVQNIVLSMDKEQVRYFKSLPWYPIYTIWNDTENEFKVKLKILPNYEFVQILYKYCDKVTVLEPQWLRDHLKKKFKDSIEKYK